MMKELKDYKEEIYKCSRCGLCQSVCPVYKVTLNECSVSRAKFNMLNGILSGDLNLNDRIKGYLDLCIGCNACKNFCPSNIDAREIFTAAKYQYYTENEPSAWEKFIDSYFVFKACLYAAKFSFFFYRLFRISFVVNLFKDVLPKRLLLLDSLIRENCRKPVRTKSSKSLRAIFFPGCFNSYLNSSSLNSLKKIFSDLDIEFDVKKFDCCGVSFLSSGKIDEFKCLARKNIEKIGDDYDFVLTDCASCNFVLKEYQKYLDSKQAQVLAQKIINVSEYLKNLRIAADRPIKVTAHKPCHEEFDFIDILKRIENVEYVEAEDFDKCCGFSGKFALKNPEISREISKRKAQKFLKTGADCIITTCPACMLGVNQGLIENKAAMPVYSLPEFIAKYCKVFTA